MGDVMPEKRKGWVYKIFNWIDLRLNKFVNINCNFCGKEMKITKTEFRAINGYGSCSDECAKMMSR